MFEKFYCEASVSLRDVTYQICYFLVAEEEAGNGIRTVVYKNDKLCGSSVIFLDFSWEKLETLVYLFCHYCVFPENFVEIIDDITQKTKTDEK